MNTDEEIPTLGVPVDEEIERMFTYHPPKHSQPDRHQFIRDNAKKLAYIVKHNSQPSRERDRAIEKLDEMVMLFNAGVSRNE